MTAHDERRAKLKLFMEGLEALAESDDLIVGCFAVLFTENGRSIAFMTPSLVADPKTALVEIGRCRNAFRINIGLTEAQIQDRGAAIARLEDGLLEGRA